MFQRILFLLALLAAAPWVSRSQSPDGGGNLLDSMYRGDSTHAFLDLARRYQDQQAALTPADSNEGGPINALRHWVDFTGARIATDAPATVNRVGAVSIALTNYLKTAASNCQSASGKYQGNWRNLGPFMNSFGSPNYATEYVGRMECLWIDPSNPNTILGGANSGGLWKTTNGGGKWTNITDPSASVIPATMGVYHIAVDPTNKNNIYLATGIFVGSRNSYGYSTGLVYSTNGGTSWQQDATVAGLLSATSNGFSGENITKIGFMPGTSKLFLIFKSKVLYKASQTAGWQDITPSGVGSVTFTDLEFTKPTSGSSSLVLSTTSTGGSAKLWVCTSSLSWSNITVTLPSGYTMDPIGIMDLCIPNSGTAYLNIRATGGINTYASKSLTTPGAALTLINGSHPYQYLEVSPANNNIVYATVHNGYENFYQSTNGGASFPNSFQGPTHADARFITIYSSTNTSTGVNDVVFGCTDGGVVKKGSGQSNFTSIVGDGLCINQFNGFSGEENDEGVLEGGTQDNATEAYIKNRTPEWSHEYGGDNYLTKFTRFGATTSYGGVNGWTSGDLFGLDFSGTSISWQNVPSLPENYAGNWWQYNLLGPLYFNTANRAHVAAYRFWTKALPDASWQRLYNFNQLPHDPTAQGWDASAVLDFIIPEKPGYGNLAYAGYRYEGSNGSNHDPTGSSAFGKLYRSDNVSLNPNPGGANGSRYTASWTNITPGAVGWWRMGDVEINPAVPEQLFVALGDIQWNTVASPPSQMTNRVLFSPNKGTTWVDISKGLPPLPINKLVYQAGSTMIYAGTDVGVFRCDMSTYKSSGPMVNNVNTSVEWTCFNSGLPPCIVSDMEINYCAGKLRISTYGRGIWESDIMNETPGYNPQMGDFVPDPLTVISSNTTWPSDQFISTGVRVTNGATLTIQNTGSVQTVVYMPKNGAIVVDPGAKIIVNGAKITNNCNAFWKGILVSGNPNLPQTAANQGTAVITNGAVLEHARLAVANYPESVNPGNFGAGGIIYADNSTFRNNARGAGFGPYHNKSVVNPNVIVNNVSYFRNCTFTVDGSPTVTGYRGEQYNYGFQCHAAMSDVEGVRFIGCGFSNTNTQPNTMGNGNGISAWNTKFSVQALCTSTSPLYQPCPAQNLIPCTFTGFLAGISAGGNNLNQYNAVSVDQATFNKNTVGVYADHAQNVSVYRSSFTIGNALRPYLAGCNCQHGIYVQNSHAFRIEENTLSASANTTFRTTGTRVDESGVYNNTVYRNTYNDLYYGAYSGGVNANLTTGTTNIVGLQYLCNVFNRPANNNLDLVAIALPPSYLYQGIASVRKWQGSPTQPAGNTFNNPSGNGHFDNDAGQFVSYYYNGSNAAVQGINVYGGPGIQSFAVSNQKSCPSNFDPYNPKDQSIPRSAFLMKRVDWNASRDDLSQHIDGGGTADLLQQVENADPSTPGPLHDRLIDVSPYVSDDVLRAVGSGGKLPPDLYAEVLQANPEALRDNGLIDWTQSADNAVQLTDQQVGLLKDAINTYTPRANLESAVADNYNAMMSAGMELLTYIKEDTTVNVDTLCYWYGQMPVLWTRYGAAWARLANNDASGKEAVLDQIVQDFTLDEAQLAEYNSYKDLMDLLTPYISEGKTELDLDSPSLQAVLAIANEGHGEASVAALTIYQKVTDNGKRWTCDGDPAGQDGKRRVPIRPLGSGAGTACLAYPNPAKDAVTFSYDLPKTEDKATLVVTSATGVVVYRTVLPDAKGTVRWEAHGVAAGTYIYRIDGETKLLANGKLTILK